MKLSLTTILQCTLAWLGVIAATGAAAQGAGNESSAARRSTMTMAAGSTLRTPPLAAAVSRRPNTNASVLVRPDAQGFGQARLHDVDDPLSEGPRGSTLTARLNNAPRAASPWRATMRFELSSREQLIIKPRARRVTIAYQATL
jgi:hypothetical protein